MPPWVAPAVVVAYTTLVLLTALSAGFSSSAEQREATFKVLRVLLPWGLFAAVAHALADIWFN